ncbi:MAG: accessory regulator [Clostridiales bacterium]|jgi:accessory gene regulator B|nr:accessory regulator [Clostridiales bacterium]MDK2934430.1 accessory regulator [Clostridiales bacterium]
MKFLVQSLTSVFVTQLDLDQEKEQVVTYALQLIISTITAYVLIIVFAYLLGILHIVLPMAIAHSVLRVCAGGAHGSTSTHCFIMGVLIFNTLGAIVKTILPLYNSTTLYVSSLLIFIFAIIIVRKFAPADVPDKPIATQAQREKLRKISLWVIVIWYAVIKLLLIITGDRYAIFVISTGWGILWQCFTLTKAGFKFTEVIDKLLIAVKV